MAFTPKSLVESVPTRLLIGGSWREASGGARFEVSDPASGAVLTTCADGTPEDGLAAPKPQGYGSPWGLEDR